MKGVSGCIQVFHALAVNVNLKYRRKIRNPLDDDSFGAILLIEERRNDGEPNFARCVQCFAQN